MYISTQTATTTALERTSMTAIKRKAHVRTIRKLYKAGKITQGEYMDRLFTMQRTLLSLLDWVNAELESIAKEE